MNQPQTLLSPTTPTRPEPRRPEPRRPEPQPSARREWGRRGPLAGCLLALLGLGCAGETGSAERALRVECTDTPESVSFDDWQCPGSMEVECIDGRAAPDVLYTDGATLPGGTCGDVGLVVDDRGPYRLGHHEVHVSTEAGALVCVAELDVVDTLPPAALALSPEPLWPPNHRMVEIAIDDCVAFEDRCDVDARAYFTHVTSDEPMDDIGDGSHEPDIALVDCERVSLRAERQGTMDGRVYTLHWRAEDASGNLVDGLCEVEVPHDRSGAPAVAGSPVVSVAGCG